MTDPYVHVLNTSAMRASLIAVVWLFVVAVALPAFGQQPPAGNEDMIKVRQGLADKLEPESRIRTSRKRWLRITRPTRSSSPSARKRRSRSAPTYTQSGSTVR